MSEAANGTLSGRIAIDQSKIVRTDVPVTGIELIFGQDTFFYTARARLMTNDGPFSSVTTSVKFWPKDKTKEDEARTQFQGIVDNVKAGLYEVRLSGNGEYTVIVK